MPKRKAAHRTLDPPELSIASSPWNSDRALNFITTVFLVAALTTVYYRVLPATFHFDDELTILSNNSIRQLWPLWGDATHPGPLRPAPQLPTAGRPLVNLSFAMNYAAGRLNPVGYRVVNLILHFSSATLLMLIVRRTLRSQRFADMFDNAAGPLAALVAILWAVHPLQTEAVTYVTQRTELLMALCMLAMLYCALRYWSISPSASRGVPAPDRSHMARKVWLALAVIACAAGMACKEVMVAAPAIVLLYDWTFVGRSVRRIARDSWPLYVGLVATWALLLYLNVGGPRSESTGFGSRVSVWAWWSTQAQVFWMYLKLVLWPWPLVIHYQPTMLETWQTASPWVVPTLLLLAGTLWLLWRQHPVAFVAASVMVILAPTSIVPILSEPAAERRMYLPLAPLIALAVTGGYIVAQSFFQRQTRFRDTASRRPFTMVAVAALLLAIAGGLVSARRLNAYTDAISLWQDAYLYQPQNFVVNYNYAGSLLTARRYDEALAILERTVQVWPTSWRARLLLGRTFVETKRLDEAQATYEKALELKPDSTAARIGLGAVYSDSGRYADAIKQFESVAQTETNDVPLQSLWGLALSRSGQIDDAIEHYNQALKLDPTHAETQNYLGVAMAKQGHVPDALMHFRLALKLNPANADAQNNLARVLLQAGDVREAIPHFEAVLQLQPDDFETHTQLTQAYVQTNQPAKAIATAENAANLARTAGQTAAAEQIQSWLREYRIQSQNLANPAPSAGTPASPALPKPQSSAN